MQPDLTSSGTFLMASHLKQPPLTPASLSTQVSEEPISDRAGGPEPATSF